MVWWIGRSWTMSHSSKYWIQKIIETKRTSVKVTTTENTIVREILKNEFKEHNITGTFAQFDFTRKLKAKGSPRTLKGTFNESMKNLEEHMRQEHEPGDDEHLANILKTINSTSDVNMKSANYTEIFNHIAQEINFVERSLSNSGLSWSRDSWNLSFIIFIFISIK